MVGGFLGIALCFAVFLPVALYWGLADAAFYRITGRSNRHGIILVTFVALMLGIAFVFAVQCPAVLAVAKDPLADPFGAPWQFWPFAIALLDIAIVAVIAMFVFMGSVMSAVFRKTA